AIREHHEGLRPRAGDFCECGFEIVRRGHLDGHRLDRKRRCGSFDISPPCELRTAAIDEDRDPGHARDQLARKFHMLAGKSIDILQQARDITPGRFSLATKPAPTGSTSKGHTMGTVADAALAASAERVMGAKIASGPSRTSCSASAGSRLRNPSANL